MIYPKPTATGSLTLYYVPSPANALSNGSDDPSSVSKGNVPVEYHPLIEWYAMYRMASYDDDASSQVGQIYKQLFDQAVFEARKDMTRRGGRKLGRLRMSGKSITPRDPSQTGYYW